MQKPIFLIALCLLAGCQSMESPKDPSQEGQQAHPPQEDVAVLVGQVLHPDGHPLGGINVNVNAGLATRFPLGVTTTDANGYYRFELDPGIFSSQSDRGTNEIFLGVYVGSVRNINPPVVAPWKDINAENAPGAVNTLDFVFDPESIPVEYRD